MKDMTPGSDRLAFRPVAAGDGPLLRAIFGDGRVADWLRPAGSAGAFSDAECDRLASAGAARWLVHGFGPWVVTDGAETVGHGGLAVKVIAGRAEIEIAWAVAADHWRRGVATLIGERALGCARELELRRIVAIARVDNAASRGVMRRLSMREQGRVMYAGMEHVFAVAAAGDAPAAT